jgi:hypothetical protein
MVVPLFARVDVMPPMYFGYIRPYLCHIYVKGCPDVIGGGYFEGVVNIQTYIN